MNYVVERSSSEQIKKNLGNKNLTSEAQTENKKIDSKQRPVMMSLGDGTCETADPPRSQCSIWNDLPYELIANICLFCPLTELCQLKLVNKDISDCIDNIVMKQMCLDSLFHPSTVDRVRGYEPFATSWHELAVKFIHNFRFSHVFNRIKYVAEECELEELDYDHDMLDLVDEDDDDDDDDDTDPDDFDGDVPHVFSNNKSENTAKVDKSSRELKCITEKQAFISNLSVSIMSGNDWNPFRTRLKLPLINGVGYEWDTTILSAVADGNSWKILVTAEFEEGTRECTSNTLPVNTPYAFGYIWEQVGKANHSSQTRPYAEGKGAVGDVITTRLVCHDDQTVEIFYIKNGQNLGRAFLVNKEQVSKNLGLNLEQLYLVPGVCLYGLSTIEMSNLKLIHL